MPLPKIDRPDMFDLLPASVLLTGRLDPKRKKKHRGNRRPKSKRLTTEYLAWINSPQWQMFKLSIIAARGMKCEACGRDGRVDLHHLHYRTLGAERPDDVRLLCYPCHQRADAGRRKRRSF
jgi:5-methylcytosine-specific restriction endonuclease McrA